MVEALFGLPTPLPTGVILLGPESWSSGSSLSHCNGRHFSSSVELLQWLKSVSHSPEAAPSRLVLIHQDAFAGQHGADELCQWLDDLRHLRLPCLPILLHADLPGKQLVQFFRAGLFDALPVPLVRSSWINTLIRAEKRLELRDQSRLILETSGEAREQLLEMRRQIGDQNTRVTNELLHSQQSLQAANRQLAEAMEELSLLFKFGRKLSAARNWDQVLRELLKSLGDFVNSGGAALILRSAQEGSYSPRQTWQWDESSWDKVLVDLQDQVNDAMAESMMAPGVFSFAPDQMSAGPRGRRVIALPLEHEKIRLGFLLLLFATPSERDEASRKFLPFLQTIQVMLSEEIASAQLLDRIRDIGKFNARVLTTVKSAIWVIDEEGRTVYCNRSGQKLLIGHAITSHTQEEFLFQIGRGRLENLMDSKTEELPELFLDARLQLDDLEGLLLPGLRKAPDGLFRSEGSILRSDGLRIPVLTQTALMAGRGRNVNWLVVVCEDLRDSRKVEIERLRADRLEGLVEMSATLAHEIRNPLMGLSAQAELLAEQLPPEDERSRYIEVITGEVDRINETITRMLNFVRPYEPDRQPTALDRLARDSVELVRSRADKKGVDLQLDLKGLDNGDLQGLAGQFHIDGGQIKQVLLNLLINAIDASPTDAVVQLVLRYSRDLQLVDSDSGTQRVQPGLDLFVTDQGPGFSPEAQKKLFRPFYTTKNTGTGLGLSICRKIVTAHGGEILAERRQDQTVFQVLLPQDVCDADTPALAKKEQA